MYTSFITRSATLEAGVIYLPVYTIQDAGTPRTLWVDTGLLPQQVLDQSSIVVWPHYAKMVIYKQ